MLFSPQQLTNSLSCWERAAQHPPRMGAIPAAAAETPTSPSPPRAYLRCGRSRAGSWGVRRDASGRARKRRDEPGCCLPCPRFLPRLRARTQPGVMSRLCFFRCFLACPPPKAVGSSSLTQSGPTAPALLLSPRAYREATGWHSPGSGLPSSPLLFLQNSEKSSSIWQEDPGAARPL